MRLFQSTTLYPSYIQRLDNLANKATDFKSRQKIFLGDRHGAIHFLQPVLDQDSTAFQASSNDTVGQEMWAREHGLARTTSEEDILLAQIEDHRADVFYNMDPVAYPSAFLKKLPGCVKKSIAWRAAPTNGADLTGYDLVVCNFPSLLGQYRQDGCKAAWFSPAHDPAMDAFAANRDRPVDLIFIGGYTRHHKRRAVLLNAFAELAQEFNIVLHLDQSRATRIADARPFRWLPFNTHKTPSSIRNIAQGPLFGTDLYRALGGAKMVLNGAIDMAGADKGNVRCFEAMGCGCTMLSDEGNYPYGMQAELNLVTYTDCSCAISRFRELMVDPDRIARTGTRAHRDIARNYSKAAQFDAFCSLVG